MNLVIADTGYKPVFNDGLSKMEMIEKMDKYLGGDLPGQIKKINDRLSLHEAETKKNINDLKSNLKKIENLLIKYEEKNSVGTDVVNMKTDKNQERFLNDLKLIIIPAIQKKLLDNEGKLEGFIKQMTANLSTDNLIENELEKKSRKDSIKTNEDDSE
jgi:hypothetical protein